MYNLDMIPKNFFYYWTGKRFPFVKIIKKTSLDASKSINNELDFVFIDGDHDYEHVLQDIEIWSKKIKKGGLIIGHDYTWNGDKKTKRSVCNAVNDFFKKNKMDYYEPIDPKRNDLINRSHDRIWWQQKQSN